jgi:hypothetical protein
MGHIPDIVYWTLFAVVTHHQNLGTKKASNLLFILGYSSLHVVIHTVHLVKRSTMG